MKSEILYVRLPTAVKAQLKKHAAKQMKDTGISPITMSTVVRQFVSEGLARAAKGGKGR